MKHVLEHRVLQFGDFRFHLDPLLLTLRDGRITLPPKALEILAVLVSRAGSLVTKDDLLRLVWLGTFVEEGNIAVYISALRKALGALCLMARHCLEQYTPSGCRNAMQNVQRMPPSGSARCACNGWAGRLPLPGIRIG
jgi:hypothetical protein